jgi:hypothetical protein
MIVVERALARGSAGDHAPYEYAFELLNGRLLGHGTTRLAKHIPCII